MNEIYGNNEWEERREECAVRYFNLRYLFLRDDAGTEVNRGGQQFIA